MLELQRYGADDYFAFIESSDDFDAPDPKVGVPDWWARLADDRRRDDRPVPDHLIWLDCIRAQSFLALPWRDEPCRINQEDDSVRRRSQLLDIPATAFVVAPLLLSRHFDDEFNLIGSLQKADWHLIRLGLEPGIPTVIAPDFDLEPGTRQWRYFEHHAECTEPEQAGLTNVFNFNFIADWTLGEDERGAPDTPPEGPDGGSSPERSRAILAALQRIRYAGR